MKANEQINDLQRQNERTLLMLWALGENLVATAEMSGVPPTEGRVKKGPHSERNV